MGGRLIVLNEEHHVADGEAVQGAIVSLGHPHGVLGMGQEPFQPRCQHSQSSGVSELTQQGHQPVSVLGSTQPDVHDATLSLPLLSPL